jgi:hypothetical protein
MPRSAGLVALAALLGAAAVTRAAQAAQAGEAAPADDLTLEIVGACPDAASIRRLLGELVTADEARGAAISIWDQGPHYRIAVRQTRTTLDDPARDCAARARQAAAIVADELRSHPQVFGPPIWTIEKGAVFDVAPGRAGTPWALGIAAVRCSVNVPLGVDPHADAAHLDAADAGDR